MKRLIAIMLAFMLALTASLFGQSPAFAAPEDAPEDEQETVNITIEYRYLGANQPQIPQTINQYGQEYRLISKNEPVKESTLPITRTYKYRINGALSNEDLDFVKQLPNVVVKPVEVVREKRVDKTVTLTGLPNNDIEYLPHSQEFEVASATSVNFLSIKELVIAGVSYEIEAYDAFGLPKSYAATVVYRGVETYAEIAYYAAESTYTTDTVEGEVDSYVIVAVYQPITGQATGAAAGATTGITTGAEGRSAANLTETSRLNNRDLPDTDSDDSLSTIPNSEVPLANVTSAEDGSADSVLTTLIILVIAVLVLALAIIALVRDRRKVGAHSR